MSDCIFICMRVRGVSWSRDREWSHHSWSLVYFRDVECWCCNVEIDLGSEYWSSKALRHGTCC